MKSVIGFIKRFVSAYSGKRISRASAALAYYLTMSVFPLIICLYSLLGKNYEKALDVLRLAKPLIADETLHTLEDFFAYVALNNSDAMLAAGIALLVTSASAAVRCLQVTIGDMQGGQRFQGLAGFAFSAAFALVFMLVMYGCITVMFLSEDVLNRINLLLPGKYISRAWLSLRYILMFILVFLVITGLFHISKRKNDGYSVLPGAMFAALAMVVISIVFSLFIASSVKYPLVYGSLASIVLLMFWLHFMCKALFCGAAFNVLLHEIGSERLRMKTGQNEKPPQS